MPVALFIDVRVEVVGFKNEKVTASVLYTLGRSAKV